MIDNIKNKIDVRLDYAQPVSIDNFCHNHTALCKDLMGEAGDILDECGWEHEFTIYYYGDFKHVRLYLRLAYVSACHLDGLWEDIKIRLHDIIPLVKSAIELRKEKNLTMLWTERQIAELEWKTTSDPFIRNEHWIKINGFI